MVRMCMDRVWLGDFGAKAAAALAVSASLLIAGCGGGGGSSPTTPPPPSGLAVSPPVFSAFGNTPNTVGIIGGTGPFTVTSSDAAVIPVTQAITGASFTFTPKNVTVATTVTLTVRDATAATVPVTVTVTPATITGMIRVTGAANSLCGLQNNPAVSVVTLCANESGSAAVTLKDANGAALPNREVRFEALSIGAGFASAANATAFSRVATALTDAQGVATVAVRGDLDVTTDAAFFRATDVTSGHRVDTWLTVLKQENGASALTTVSGSGGVVGYFVNECPRVRRDYHVYGGKAPYAVTMPAGSTLILSNASGSSAAGAGTTVATAGDKFSAENVASSTCTTSTTTLTVTDSLGATYQPTFTIAPGASTRPTTSTELMIVPAAVSTVTGALSTHCTSSTADFVISGGTAPYTVTAAIPQVLTTKTSATAVTASYLSDAKWKMLKGQSTSILVLDAAGKIVIATLNCT